MKVPSMSILNDKIFMQWSQKKTVWYGFAAQESIIEATFETKKNFETCF